LSSYDENFDRCTGRGLGCLSAKPSIGLGAPASAETRGTVLPLFNSHNQLKTGSCHSTPQPSTYIHTLALQHTISETMAPLLKSLYRPSQRSLLSSLFTATFLGAVVVVAFPCPIRPSNLSGRAEARLDGDEVTNTTSPTRRNGEVVVLMNQRGRRFLEER